jgi:hypothetical protein
MGIILTGLSGRRVALDRCDWQRTWKTVPLIYAFGGSDFPTNPTVPLYYIGETGNAAARMPGHEKWLPALIMGATDVYSVVMHNEHDRLDLERDLISYHKPPLNTEYTSGPSLVDYATELFVRHGVGALGGFGGLVEPPAGTRGLLPRIR